MGPISACRILLKHKTAVGSACAAVTRAVRGGWFTSFAKARSIVPMLRSLGLTARFWPANFREIWAVEAAVQGYARFIISG